MRLGIAIEKLDNMLNVLFIVQIVTMLKNTGWSIFIATTSGSSGTYFGGIIFRSLLQGFLTIYFINKMKVSFSTAKAWAIFISCLLVGFASLGSVVSPSILYFNFGIFEIALVLSSMLFMVRYYNYKSAVSRETT
ncbi:hypothetical protein [Enterococcus rivorum]|uniref:Uncharacterized protein n=1 Tax=Enterococcus rivorum TaxID=762845 RepID=A0A1E5KWK9_9ENTE|nr:hypothetical protein [Enterococcus rivorum]MBP2099112.1 hypothetical protein [Enterococcus rivorum]OEH82263.1 hypothetical protein BCR26_13515 [Enterococcus rivorum]